MHPKSFIDRLEDRKIVDAIARAESISSGEIRVYISDRQVDDVVSEAKVQFLRLGMDKTRARNGVLIYIAPRSRNFAVVGDVGVDAVCKSTLWQEVAVTMESHLKGERYTDALVAAIERVGAVLGTHFPRRPDDTNELPNAIVRD